MAETSSTEWADLVVDATYARVQLTGHWDTLALSRLERRLREMVWPAARELELDASGIDRLDTGGALLLLQLTRQLEQAGLRWHFNGLQPSHQALLELVSRRIPGQPLEPPARPFGRIATLGRASSLYLLQFFGLLAFAGELMSRLGVSLMHPRRIRWRELFDEIYSGGVTALPILGLLSLLIGVVVAYQGGVQLDRYGANIYIVDLIALTTVRDLAPLMTAIIVAGRTGSAYAAQIGTMKVTEEISALRTIGIDPMELLVIPKLLALMLSLPLLTLMADVMSILGGMLMSDLTIGVTPDVFIDRLPHVFAFERSFLLGVGKAPVFAVIIALIGCFQGFQVQGGADAVGRHTTISVVLSIFLVIVADALFSIYFSWLGI
jgi:phospholipid/cholesterol/gamma-HCH transport system permease protein